MSAFLESLFSLVRGTPSVIREDSVHGFRGKYVDTTPSDCVITEPLRSSLDGSSLWEEEVVAGVNATVVIM